MERAFRATKESKYYQAEMKFDEVRKNQNENVNEFCKTNEINANVYMVSGCGCVNNPFSEFSKKSILFHIVPKDEDMEKFSKYLCKPDERGLMQFKKNSKIAKEFQNYCIENKVVINLHEPRIGDYFEKMFLYGCKYTRLFRKDEIYVKIESDGLKEDDIPDGMEVIKMSEFYAELEKYKEETEG